MITDNLASLFAPNPRGAALPATFRMGVLAAFNADDGSNTVVIGTSEIPDLPLLVTGAEIGLEPGDNVLIMLLGNTMLIVGKIATVGGSNYGPANNGHDGFQDVVANFSAASTGTVIISDTSLVVPGWAHSGLVTMLGSGGMNNNGGVDNDDLTSQVKLSCPSQSDVTANSHHNDVSSGNYGATNAYLSEIVPLTPGATLTCQYLIGPAHNWSADPLNGATLSVSVQYFRESAT